MDFLELLNRSFKEKGDGKSRLDWLSSSVFNFTTHHDVMGEVFARRAIEVCVSITFNNTFRYQKLGMEEYTWYLMMCNTPFFSGKIHYGSSIRGAWWSTTGSFDLECHRWAVDDDGVQILDSDKLTQHQFEEFVKAMVKFTKVDDA